MTIPSTGPLRHLPRELAVRRDRRPDWLLGLASVLTLGVLVLALLIATSDRPVGGGQLAVVALLCGLIVASIVTAYLLLQPRWLPTIEQQPTMPTKGPRDPGSVSPDPPRGSWPFTPRT